MARSWSVTWRSKSRTTFSWPACSASSSSIFSRRRAISALVVTR